MSERMSLREFARQNRVGEKAVRKAVGSGRLRASVGRDERGRPFIADPALAAEEWTKNARKTRTRSASGRASVDAAAGTQAANAATLNESQLSVNVERARKLKRENDVAAGRLVDVDEARAEAFESSRIIRDAMLNIAARFSAELAAETDANRVHSKLTAAIREALETTAGRLRESAESLDHKESENLNG